MKKEIEIRQGNNGYREAVVTLLKSENLPVEDLPASLDNFFIAVDHNNIVGAIGLENYNNGGLLRSLVVDVDYRNEKIAGKLVTQLEEKAKTLGINEMYLLTETAPEYFANKGYQKINRTEVPTHMQQSSEFSHVCPASAIVMKKALL